VNGRTLYIQGRGPETGKTAKNNGGSTTPPRAYMTETVPDNTEKCVTTPYYRT